jgi:hypothetical protein
MALVRVTNVGVAIADGIRAYQAGLGQDGWRKPSPGARMSISSAPWWLVGGFAAVAKMRIST